MSVHRLSGRDKGSYPNLNTTSTVIACPKLHDSNKNKKDGLLTISGDRLTGEAWGSILSRSGGECPSLLQFKQLKTRKLHFLFTLRCARGYMSILNLQWMVQDGNYWLFRFGCSKMYMIYVRTKQVNLPCLTFSFIYLRHSPHFFGWSWTSMVTQSLSWIGFILSSSVYDSADCRVKSPITFLIIEFGAFHFLTSSGLIIAHFTEPSSSPTQSAYYTSC